MCEPRGSARTRATAQHSRDLSFQANQRETWLIIGKKHIHAIEREQALPGSCGREGKPHV